MSSIVRQKVGDKIYLYESVSYRNEDGKPRNKRVPVGRIDPRTNQPVYKSFYLDRMAEAGTPVELPAAELSFTADNIYNSSIKEYGAFYLYQSIAEKIGLYGVLQKTFPKHWKKVFTLACFLVSSGEPFSYCENWLQSTESLDIGNMTSQRISELLTAVTPEEREAFYHAWCCCRSEVEYLALDITSSSSYSNLIEDVEWGYNRDGEQLPQINICMLMGEKSRLPVYQTVYSGSLKDVSTLEVTIKKFQSIAGEKPMLTVMDKGFFSTQNINMMLSEKFNTRFIIAVPFTGTFARKQVELERKDIDCLENTIVVGGDTIRAVTKLRSWNTNHKVYTHTYFNVLKAMKIREDLYTYVSLLKEKAAENPAKALHDSEYEKYLIIRKSEKAETGYTVNVRADIVTNELRTAGWMVIISNDVSDAKEAITIYRDKDVVEKGFLRLKNSLDLCRLRVHHECSMQNKVFVGFIALILLSYIHSVMSDKKLYSTMTMKKMILTLSKLRVQNINGYRILFPLTKDQKDIYKAFDIIQPV